MNPMNRHNLVTFPHVRPLRTNADGTGVANPFQKPVGLVKRLLRPCLSHVTGDANANALVLGCGQGSDVEAFARMGAHVHAIDIRKGQLELTLSRLQSAQRWDSATEYKEMFPVMQWNDLKRAVAVVPALQQKLDAANAKLAKRMSDDEHVHDNAHALSPKPKDVVCKLCGTGALPASINKCAKGGCTVMAHSQCATQSTSGELFCSARHAGVAVPPPESGSPRETPVTAASGAGSNLDLQRSTSTTSNDKTIQHSVG
jgi:hypothetical protein